MTFACEKYVKTSLRGRGRGHLHMKKMSKLPRGGRGQGHLYAIHYLAPSPATKCPLFHKLKYGHPTKLVDSSSTGGTCLISLTDTIQLLSLLSPSLITRSLILF